MGRRSGGMAMLLAALALWLAPAAASATPIAWSVCSQNPDLACGHVAVPLDRSGAQPGTIELAVRRHRGTIGDGSDAIVALAGGPGQAALPLLTSFLEVLGSTGASHDLLVFDQRGTGLSGALHCSSLKRYGPDSNPPAPAIAACAAQLGAGTADYATSASVADLEAVREATGYQKLILYGTSYGTIVALDYARAYPEHVEALLLDSTLPPAGLDPFALESYPAIRRVLTQLCAGRACAGVTHTPVADVARLAVRLARHPLRGRVFSPQGRPHTVRVVEHNLFDILLEGDLEPDVRADFPAAVRSALAGDNAPIASLWARAENPNAGGGSGGLSLADFYAAACADLSFPWDQAAAPNERLMELDQAARALPPSSVYPFDAGTAVFEGPGPCAAWPAQPTPAPQSAPLPDVPTLILSGTEDLRTPTENATAVASEIPGARVLVVPDTGHSVLSSDPSRCSMTAVTTFFLGQAITPCRPPRPAAALYHPTRILPAHLGALRPANGVPGRDGRTLAATELTVGYAERLLAIAITNSPGVNEPTRVAVGGLRGGDATFDASGLMLHHFSVVGGVWLDALRRGGVELVHVGGPSAAPGTLTISTRGDINGVLAGRAVHVHVPGSG